jgi:transcriptional regulator with XRE-family HTH domain
VKTQTIDWSTMRDVPLRLDGEKVRDLRRERGLSQEMLARRAHMSYRTISRIEHGESQSARELTVLALAGALDVEPTDLLAEGQSPNTLPGGEAF